MADLTIEEEIFENTTSQNLATAALSFTTSLSTDFRLVSIFFKFTAAVSQTITITLDSLQGASFDTIIGTRLLSSNTDVQFIPAAIDQDFKDGDEIKIQCTNTATPASTVSVVIVTEQR